MYNTLFFLSACSDFELHSTEKSTNPQPEIEVSPSAYNYGLQAPESTATQTFQIKNNGEAALSIEEISLVGSGSFAFFFTPEAIRIPPGSHHDIEILFTASGGDEEGFFLIENNDSTQNTLHIPLSGSSPTAALVLSPNPLDFGFVAQHSTQVQEVMIQNIGAIPTQIETLYVDGNDFFDGETILPITLESGAHTSIEIQFSPSQEDEYEGSLWVGSDIGTHMVQLLGTSEEPIIEEDPCLDPDLSYDQHPQAKLHVNNALTPVVAEYLLTNAGYTNELWLQSPHLIHIATGHQTPENTLVDLGMLAQGQELFFKMYVQDTGHHYYSGPAHRNPDQKIHAAISYLGDCAWMVGFEDMYDGGDQDFDDILMILSGDLSLIP